MVPGETIPSTIPRTDGTDSGGLLLIVFACCAGYLFAVLALIQIVGNVPFAHRLVPPYGVHVFG